MRQFALQLPFIQQITIEMKIPMKYFIGIFISIWKSNKNPSKSKLLLTYQIIQLIKIPYKTGIIQ
jgi:hypothetical protein